MGSITETGFTIFEEILFYMLKSHSVNAESSKLTHIGIRIGKVEKFSSHSFQNSNYFQMSEIDV